MVFDVRAAKQLNSGEVVTVDGCPGLRLVATSTSKSWTYRYRNHAKQLKQVKLGVWPEMSFQEAVAAWGTLKSKRDAGEDLAQQKREERSAIKRAQESRVLAPPEDAVYRVKHVVDDFVKGHIYEARKAEGAAAAESALRRFLSANPDLAQMPAAEVTRKHAFAAIETVKAKPASAAKLRSLMGAAWDYALDAGRFEGDVPNWWRSIMKGRLKSKGKIMQGVHQGKKRRFITDEELRVLLPWIYKHMHEVARDAVVLYLSTGVRGGEIFSMRVQHFSERDGVLWWTIPKELTKNAHIELATDLRVPMLGAAREIVTRRIKAAGSDGFLFVDRAGKQYQQKALSTYIYDLQPYSPKSKRIGRKREILPVTHWSPHDLRRTARTMLASCGCLKEVAEAIVGHLPPEIEATYNAYSYDKERVHWLQVVSDKLEGLGLPRRP